MRKEWKDIIAECILDYKPIGRRGVGRPGKRWKDSWAGRGLKAYE
jgi:hypothetical protein